MTPTEAKEIIDRATQMWPFQRLTDKELKELEEAYSVVKNQKMTELGEPPF